MKRIEDILTTDIIDTVRRIRISEDAAERLAYAGVVLGMAQELFEQQGGHDGK